MPPPGWPQLLSGAPWFQGEGSYPIPAYSEFMPPPRLGRTPYGAEDPSPFVEGDPRGWHITECEEALEFGRGLGVIAGQIVGALARLGQGKSSHGIAKAKLVDNPYWPTQLAERAGELRHERFVTFMPLAFSRTQDDKGRIRWTLFGGSEQGPSRALWRSFAEPGGGRRVDAALGWMRRLLQTAYRERAEDVADLHRAGFRILPDGDGEALRPDWREDRLPAWTAPYLWEPGRSLAGVRYLLTFRPFGRLPEPVRRAYLAGGLHLLPSPGSLLFWGIEPYARLGRELPLAEQVPALNLVARHEGAHGLRVPQSGWLHEPRPGRPKPGGQHGPILDTFRRTHRTARTPRDAPHEEAVSPREDKLAHALFSTDPKDLGLYDKPLARNVQLWTEDYRPLLDGLRSGRPEIGRAAAALRDGGLFGYRFVYPAMRVGRHEVYWHRPLVAYLDPETGRPAVLPDAPLGYLTAYDVDRPDPSRPIELWPRLMARPAHVEAVGLFQGADDPRPHQTSLNVRKLLDARQLLGRPLPRPFARRLLTAPKRQTLDGWLDSLPGRADDPERAARLVGELRALLEPAPRATHPVRDLPESLTFGRTSRRGFEVAYWKAIAAITKGRFPNRNNADCVLTPATRAALRHHHRDLGRLGDFLLAHYANAISAAGMQGKAVAGDLPFRWRTEFDYTWSGGWLDNQGATPHERDLIVVIPGRDRTRAIVMADHYDTAYREDVYRKKGGRGEGPHIAAPGSDDNTSATATLMMATTPLLALSRAGRLGCDVWLVHLTGEEFPADSLGARHLASRLVEGGLAMRRADGRWLDLSGTRVAGIYVLDMVGYNNPRNRDVFQIAPGGSREALTLAEHAHRANEAWNASTDSWNRRSSRRDAGRGRGRAEAVPEIARHPQLVGEVRPHDDSRSTLFNTDGQIFSDAGLPVVLFMEDYDIDRSGYHDSRDTLARVELAYASALAAIAIESVALAANATAP
jgi:hypothetical protein